MHDRSASERRPQVDVATKVALIHVDVAHDHDLGRVPQDPPEPLDLTSLAQVLGGEGVPEAESLDAKPDLDPDAAVGLGYRNESNWLAIGPQQEVVASRLWPQAVQVADQIPAKPAADRDPPELRGLAMSDLEEGASWSSS